MVFKNGFHPFHIVDMSPWPLFGSLSAMSSILSLYLVLNSLEVLSVFIFCLFSLLMVSFQWWRDVVRESTYQGFHSNKVCSGLSLGVVLFILSEVMFFFSFFFGYFFIALNPDIEIGMCWPPKGIQPLNYMGVPFLNTIILLSSGISITWAHHSILCSNYNQSLISLSITIFLGVIFSFFQGMEYYESSFTMSDGVFGSLFFIATGFHGFHVMIGMIFISVCFFRLLMYQMSDRHHIGFESAAWYWHFVDVVWLFLFVSIYWWGS
uniref:cytochrome c oxidase subunit III n=1 Tax=Falcolipeurus marginalis TaxID=236517 RepID=UPI00211E18A2|nr:cytochrome c oxidase subunit III [Falcolipeurus marginalis]UTT72598.1 cytochrome c oxidase subunit 3 [Falcolipeurus marginalis]